MVRLRRCTKCRKIKGAKHFVKDIKQNSGLYPSCKACKKRYDKKYKTSIETRRKLLLRKRCCKCGKIKKAKEFKKSNTLSGLFSYCRKCGQAYSRALRRRRPEPFLLASAKARAKKKGLRFSLREEHIVVPTHCPVLGIPLRYANSGFKDHSPTIDRVVPGKGYIPSNIQIVSYRANRFKSDATLEEMEKMLKFYRKLLRK